MTICKRLVPPNHLQEASLSGWPSARGQSLWIIIYKRPAPPNDHLQEVGPYGSSFARVRLLILTTTKRAWKMLRGSVDTMGSPGLKTICEFFLLLLLLTLLAKSILIIALSFFREKSATVSSVDELYCLLRNRCNILFWCLLLFRCRLTFIFDKSWK